MGHWTPTGIEPTDYDDDDDYVACLILIAFTAQSRILIYFKVRF